MAKRPTTTTTYRLRRDTLALIDELANLHEVTKGNVVEIAIESVRDPSVFREAHAEILDRQAREIRGS